MVTRNCILLQQWYWEQNTNDTNIWFTLSQASFNTWKALSFHATISAAQPTVLPATQTVIPTTTTEIKTTSAADTFKRSIKRSIDDYVKLKDDNRWKQWHRSLKATARNHGLGNILDPTYVPNNTDDIELFKCQNTFMYSVFEQCLNTTKGRHVVQLFETTANAQAVYAGLLKAYEETLTTNLAATDLRSELVLLRFDDSWKRGSEAFLLHWQTKVLELEQLEDKAVDDTTKRLWLTTTLSTKSHMESCLTQAKITEMTMLGMANFVNNEMPWDSFYNLILAHAKLHDHNTPTKPRREANLNERGRGRGDGRGRFGRGRGRGRGRGGPGRGDSSYVNNTDKVWTTVTGHGMVMKANMLFTDDEFAKLTFAQKNALRVAKGQVPWTPRFPASEQPRSINNSMVYPVLPTNPTIATPTGDTSDSHLRQLLSNKHVRFSEETPEPSTQQVTYQGQLYQRVVKVANVIYNLNNASIAQQLGSLIDGGANGGMSGDDVRVLEYSLNRADISGLADHAVKDLPIVTAAACISTSRGFIIGVFHQYAHLGTGKTIHSSNQLRHFGLLICDTPRVLGGDQRLRHPDGYVIPLSIRNGLPYLDMWKP
jgi:hypothetical protein